MSQLTASSHQVAMLRSIRGFSELSDIDLVNLSGQLRWSRIEPGKALFLNDPNELRTFLICRGSVRAIIYAENGREITYEEYHAGNFVGEVSAIDRKPRLTHVVAITETIVASMDAGTFNKVMHQHNELAAEVTVKMCETIRSLSDRVYELSALPVVRRIDLDLYRLATKSSENGLSAAVVPAPKHAEIASRASTQRETVTKRMTTLRKLGVIETTGRRMLVPDLKKLQQLCH